MSFTKITGPGISSYPVIVGIITALNFKSGTTNIHNVGVEAAGINVLGGDTPIGTGATIFKDGSVRFGHTGNNNTGIITANKVDAPTITATTVTATTFSGDGSNLTSLPAGLGTALSSTQTSPLNKLYYTDNVLSIGATITINPPSSASAAYTQYTDIVADGADIIVADGDDFIPDILGISTDTVPSYSGSGGRVRAGKFTNTGANGAPTATNGWIVTGVCTATTFKGNLTGNVTGTASQLETNATGANLTLSGNLGVGGTITYEDVARVDATGISTFREGLKIGPLAGIALTAYTDGSIRTSGIITANTYYGSGANLTGIDATQIVTGNTSVQTVDTGSDGHIKINTEGSERIRIGPAGQFGIGGATYGSSGQVLTSGGASAAPSWATPTSSLSDQSIQAEQVTDQAMGTNAWNLVKFNAQNWDTGNNYDHNNGNWYYQAPSNGKYWYKASAKLIDLAADKEFDIALYKSTDNGGSYTIQKKSQRWVFTRENTASVVIVETTGLMSLNANDRIRVYTWHNHGSNRNIDDNFTLFEVFRLGD